MSVASKNPFALLNDIEKEEEKPAKQDGQIDVPKPNRKPATTRGGRYYQRGAPKPAISSAPPTTDPLSPTGDKGERRPPREDRGDRGDRPFRGDRGDRPFRGERGGERGGRGGRRGSGGGGRGGYDRDARLDRHSATGITDSQKKVHQGWGGDRGDTEYKDETQGANDAAGDAWGASGGGDAAAAPAAAGGGWDAPAPAEGATDDPWAVPSGDAAEGGDAKGAAAGDDEGRKKKRAEDEEEDNTMTLDQYRAKTAAGESEAIPKLELRKANEGTSELFKGAKQLVKDVDANNYFVGKQPKQNAPRARKEAKQYIEIEARFDPPSRGGRGRGRGDRGDRGGGYRGGDRGDRGSYRGRGERSGGRGQQAAEVNMDDTNAFPSL